MQTLALLLRAGSRRLIGLSAFALLFLLAGAAARVFAGHEGHVEAERLLLIGGYPLVSMLLLAGWLIARFPMIAALVLLAGVVSDDRTSGLARLLRVRPRSPLAHYALRALVFGSIAFLMSAVLVPAFDALILGRWTGGAAFVVIAAHVLVYGSLTAVLSVFTRADAWVALFLGFFAIVWHALRTADALAHTPPGIREVITFVLPPQGALAALETAFAEMLPVPWEAFAFVVAYSALLLVIGGMFLGQREI
jgi:hypothetical protein